jgi:ABC-type multidrug transport system ATPase subunit
VRRRVGLLGHSTGLYEDLTVAENVRFWARAAGGTVVVSSHELERVRSLSPRVVTLAGGTVHRDTGA